MKVIRQWRFPLHPLNLLLQMDHRRYQIACCLTHCNADLHSCPTLFWAWPGLQIVECDKCGWLILMDIQYTRASIQLSYSNRLYIQNLQYIKQLKRIIGLTVLNWILHAWGGQLIEEDHINISKVQKWKIDMIPSDCNNGYPRSVSADTILIKSNVCMDSTPCVLD